MAKQNKYNDMADKYWAEVKEMIAQNDTVDLTYTISDSENAGSDPVAGKQLDMVIQDALGNVIKILSSVGDNPAITIGSAYTFNIDTTGFASPGTYFGELINNTDNIRLVDFTFEVYASKVSRA